MVGDQMNMSVFTYEPTGIRWLRVGHLNGFGAFDVASWRVASWCHDDNVACVLVGQVDLADLDDLADPDDLPDPLDRLTD
jgi:hypothetical protein